MRNFRSLPPLLGDPTSSFARPSSPPSQSPSSSPSRSQSQSRSQSSSPSQSQSHSQSRSSPPSQSRSPSAFSAPSTFAFQRLDCYRVARALAASVHRASIADAELRDQATRASKSCFLCLCEGLPNDRPAMRRKYFTEANNSLHETVGAVDLAGAIGALGAGPAAEIQALAVRLRRLLRGLLNPTGRAR